jgi:anti-sigma factor RsiW
MSCRSQRHKLSEWLDGDLPLVEVRALSAHLAGCPECAAEAQALRRVRALVAELPRVEPLESVAARVLDQLEVESRGTLPLLFRPAWRARPLLLPSLLPAALVLVTVVAAALGLSRGPASRGVIALHGAWDAPASGTEANPLFPSAGVGVPRTRSSGSTEQALTDMAEGTLFVETVVARDGSVSAVRLLEGDSRQAQPLLDALRQERFEPVRYQGRRVAVSLYRLISRMDVRPPTI